MDVELCHEEPKVANRDEAMPDDDDEKVIPEASTADPSLEDNSEADELNDGRRKRRKRLAIGCGSCLLIVGIVLLVLGLQGYLTFEEPCVGVKNMTIADRTLGYDNPSNESNPLYAFVDVLTGIAGASALVPKQVNLTLNLIVQVNNTNPYDLDFEQSEEGKIVIPPSSSGENGDDDDGIPPEHEDDLTVGTWEVPGSTLKKRAQNEIPVTITAEIDLLHSDDIGLMTAFLKGGDLVFRVQGGFGGSSWVPGLSGRTDMICLAKVVQDENTDDRESKIRCTKSTKIGRLIRNTSGRRGLHLGGDGATAFLGQAGEVDPRCLV